MPARAIRWLLPTVSDVLFLCFFLGMLITVEGPARFLLSEDTGWHLVAGDWMLKNRRMPARDPFSYSSAGAPWVAYEYLSELVMAGSERVGGLTGVVALASLVIAATLAGLYRILRRQGISLPIALIATLVAVIPLSVHWLARPHLASMLFLVLFLDRFDRYARGEPVRLWSLPLWMALWVQFHGGFLLGLILWGAHLAGLLLERKHFGGGAPPARPLLLVGFAMAGTAVLHPDGYRLPGYIVRYLSFRWIFDHNREFASANFHQPQILVFGAWLVLLVLMAVLGRYRPRPREIVPPLAFAALALYSARHIPYAVLVGAPLLARMLEASAPSWRWWGRLRRAGEMEARLMGGCWSVAGVMGVFLLLATGAWGRLGLPGFGFHRSYFPVNASGFVERSALPDRMFNPDDWGGYLLYRLYPRYHVFIDGRQDMYGESFAREYWEVARAGKRWSEVLVRYGVEWVIWPADEALSSVLQASPEWRLVFQDETACIFEKKKNATGGDGH